ILIQYRTGTVTARDAGGQEYRIEIWRDVRTLPGGGEEFGATDLRHNALPVERVARGAYRIRAGFSPTGKNLDLTSGDPDAP
ncbi:MAG TPA: hypothetical protein VH092_36090, partial [Urbifossiella sp.]|nr:hypothetical protein [Urbifossiella sp.]